MSDVENVLLTAMPPNSPHDLVSKAVHTLVYHILPEPQRNAAFSPPTPHAAVLAKDHFVAFAKRLPPEILSGILDFSFPLDASARPSVML